MNQPFSIRECLHGYADETLGAMCEHWRLAATSKPSRVKALERVLGDSLHVKSVVSGLDAASVRMLKLAVAKGPIPAGDLLGVPGLLGTHQPSHVLRQLAQSGLVLVSPSDRNGVFTLGMLAKERLNGHRGPDLFVPAQVAPVLPSTPALGLKLAVLDEAPEPLASPTSSRFTQTMLDIFRIVDLVEPRITTAGELHRNDEARIEELRREAGLSRENVALAVMMARQLGCLTVENRKLVTSSRADRWTERSRAQRMRDLFWAYVTSPGLADLKLFFPEIYGALEEHLPAGSVRRSYHRELAAAILRESPENAWHPLDALADAVAQTDRNILCLEERWRAILAHAQDSGSAWQERAWSAGEKRLFNWMTQSLLADLGMVDLGAQNQGFRLNAHGRFVLGIGPEPEEPHRERDSALTVQPDFEVIVYLDRCDPPLQRKLGQFCERRRGGAASTFALTQQSIYRGARIGIPPATALQILAESSSHPLPPNVREQVAAWQRKMDAITIRRNCTLLEYSSGAARDSAVAAYAGARPIGDRYLLAAETPAQSTARLDYSAGIKPALIQEEGLRFRLPWEHVDLFAHKRLAEIGHVEANKAGDLCVRLDRAKANRPEDWNLIAAQLESLTAEPLEARYRLTLRAWSGELGPASAGPVTLLRFDDLDTCQAVLEFPEVSEYIEGRVGLYALVVRKGKLGQIKKALRSHGISIQTSASLADQKPPQEWIGEWADRRQNYADESQDIAATAPGDKSVAEHRETLPRYSPRIISELLADAISRRKPAMIEYRPTWSKQPSVRRVDPVSLDVSAASPFLSGYCHTAHSARTFQLARIQGIRILEDETF